MRRIASVRLTERFDQLLESLPSGWTQAVVQLGVADPADADRSAATLAPLAPGRAGATFSVRVSQSGSEAPSADAVRRILARLEAQGVDARLGIDAREAAVRVEEARRRLVESWDGLLDELPPDWSDLYLEVELASSSDVEHGALLLGPVNPLLVEGRRPAFRFRAARRFGYGAAPAMVRRALERLDEEGIGGRLEPLRVMSETAPVLTQGPVWRDGGRAV
jgi:hypothetical protein